MMTVVTTVTLKDETRNQWDRAMHERVRAASDVNGWVARSWPASRTDRPTPSGKTWWRNRAEELMGRRRRRLSPALPRHKHPEIRICLRSPDSGNVGRPRAFKRVTSPQVGRKRSTLTIDS